MIITGIGNYPKVAEGSYGTKLIGAFTRRQRQELSDAELKQVFQDITRAVIKEQEEAGLELLTDGQIRWEDLVTPIARRLEGFEINGLTRFFDNNVLYRRPILHRVPKRAGPILVDDYRFAAGSTSKPVKAILPGPFTFVSLSEDRHFKAQRPFVLRMAELLNEEAAALAQAGAPVIQFDEPALGFGKPNVKLAVEALNVAVRGLNAKTAVVTYFGRLDGVLEPLARANVDVIGVDVVSEPRTLSSLKRVKLSKELALGCVDARNTKLESVAELHVWFDVASKLVPSDWLWVSPNCGLEFLPHEKAVLKLKRLVEAVRTYRPAPRIRSVHGSTRQAGRRATKKG